MTRYIMLLWPHANARYQAETVHLAEAELSLMLDRLAPGTAVSRETGLDMPSLLIEFDEPPKSGVIEALRHGTLPVFSVQWHPERMCLERAREDAVDGSAVLRHFLSMCAEHGKRCR